MFKKTQDVEQDFMQYSTENTNFENQEKSSLDKMIKILIILVLLGVLIGVGVFIYKYFTKDSLSIDANTTPTSSHDNGVKKVYTQEDMQAIVQMIVKQMEDKQKGSTTNNNHQTDLVETLKKTKVVEPKITEKQIATEIKKIDKSKKIENKKSKNDVNHYNKVVLSSDVSSDDKMLNLSKGLDEIILTQDNVKKDKYTKMISKELAVRENEMRVIVVQAGDTLSLIAERAYGSSQAFNILLRANPELIKNPNLIHIGQRLRVPLVKK